MGATIYIEPTNPLKKILPVNAPSGFWEMLENALGYCNTEVIRIETKDRDLIVGLRAGAPSEHESFTKILELIQEYKSLVITRGY